MKNSVADLSEKHREGICIPASLATSMMVKPSAASKSILSILILSINIYYFNSFFGTNNSAIIAFSAY